MIKLTIDGKAVEAQAGKTVLEAALDAGIYIPNLCYHPDIPPIGACRLCVVEIDGMRGVPASCTIPVKEGMVVRTDTDKVRELRKDVLWLTMSEYAGDPEKGSQLQEVATWIGAKDLLPGSARKISKVPPAIDNPFLVRDLDKCILCGRCVRMCQDVRKTGAIGLVNRGIKTVIGTGCGAPLQESGCRFCLACVEVCPSGALQDRKKFEEKERAKTLLPCVNTCPAGIDIPRYVRLISEGKYQDSLEVIREKVPFPLALGYVCNHPCEQSCRRDALDEPISIRALKRFVAERDNGRWRSKLVFPPPTGKKAAIVGSGPGGLTAAWYLKLAGHDVTVFEAMSEPGGMMRTAIPAYRLPRKVLAGEIKEMTDIGVKIVLNTRVNSADELFEKGFDAVFVAVGAPAGMKMGVEGETDKRVLDGIYFLQAVSFGQKTGVAGDVLVIGGGNVAMDVARTALRVGAKKVTVLYRRTREEMPALPEEVAEAMLEGVKFRFLTAPEKVLQSGKKLGLDCILMELGEPDASGRRRPVPVEGSNIVIKADWVITAIGQRPAVPEGFALPVDKKCCIQADPETMACARPGVFAGGDAVTGPASVIEAIKGARKAAVSMDKYLGGDGIIDRPFLPAEEPPVALGRDEGFCSAERCEQAYIPVSKRRKNFKLVELVLTEKEARAASKRCMRCELRLKISKAPLPPKKKD